MQNEDTAKATQSQTPEPMPDSVDGAWDSTSANEMLVGGVALGTFGTAAVLLAGVVCPVCTIGTPLLLGGGIAKKLQERKRKRTLKTSPSLPPA